jgi:hypothetical protein
MDAQRRRILKRLDAFDAGPTEDDRRAERQAAIQRAIEAEQDLKWGRLSAGIAGGISGRSVPPYSGMRAGMQPAWHDTSKRRKVCLSPDYPPILVQV